MTSTGQRALSLTFAAVALVASLWSLAIAQEFPTRSIELLVPYPPGGSSDALARAIAPTLEKELGQTIAVVNKPGAGGIVAGTLTAKSKPDGYTILIASSTALVLSPRLQQVDYDSLKDFTYISLVARLIPMVLVRSDAPWKTLEDLVAYAKNNPGKIRYGTSGPHSGTHIAMASIAKEKGLDWIHVPFKGDGPVVTGILGGHVEAAVVYSVYKPQVAAGKLRPLVSLMDKRTKHFPDVPTYKELGFTFDTRGSIQSITGIIAPAKLPPAIVAKYEAALKKAVDSPEFARTVETLGMEADFRPAAEYRREMEEGYGNAGRMLKDVGIVK